MTTTEQQAPRVYSDEEIRHAVNSETPFEALELTLILFQRLTLALESMAMSMQEPPTVLFEQAPTSDGLGMMDSIARGADDKEH